MELKPGIKNRTEMTVTEELCANAWGSGGLQVYATPAMDSAAGTTVSGIVGAAIVAGVAILICLIGGFFRKRKLKTE